VVLGGHGAIGHAVIKELQLKGIPARAVERSKNVPGVETFKADLLDLQQVTNATKGSSHIYLCIGIPYKSKIWENEWPIVMNNVINACEKANSKLIFFDNVYMYGPSPLSIPFDESHPQEPESKKGKTRKLIADMLLNAHKEGRVKAVIGRSSDFYGPGAVNSQFYTVFLERMMKGKAPQWLGKPKIKHTYAYTIDNGKALVALALDESTFGQTWHLPVGDPITIEEIIEIFNRELNSNYKISFIPRWMLGLMSTFIPPIKEAKEMLYQFDNEYIMSSEKFKKHFPDFIVTNYVESIQEMIRSFNLDR
jgi:nucleoside-diphosphate-sugar epimerase